MTRLALIGVSVRALAESAALTGEEVVAADFFGDRDLAQACESYAVGRDLGLPLTAQGLATAARRLRADAVVYTANLENHPEVVGEISGWARVIGNDAATLARVRDWASLRRVCAAAGIAVPETLLPGEERRARAGVRWLRKRRRSGGGHGVRRWCGRALDADHLLQAEIPGRPASVAFVADGQGARVLAVSEQLIGRRRLGARGFTWCGNLVPFTTAPAEADALLPQARRAATVLTRYYGLRGLNGLDCVVARDADGAPQLWLIEVNPRFTASMELAEAAVGRSLFALHVAACEGRLPADLLERDSFSFYVLKVQLSDGTVKTKRLNAEAFRKITSFANIKIRSRMVHLYAEAEQRNAVVVGTTNRTEYLLGDFCKYGDGGTDIEPIAHLYKNQIYQLAEYLGVIREIIERTPSPDTFSLPVSDQEFFFRIPFTKLDHLLFAWEHGIPAEKAAEVLGLSREAVMRAFTDFTTKNRSTAHLREMPGSMEKAS